MLHSTPELQSLAACGLAEVLTWASTRRLKFGFGRSAKFHRSGFETRRVLLSFSISDIGVDALAETMSNCRMLQIPMAESAEHQRFHSGSAYVHFGFEHAGNTVIGKYYLELPPPAVPVGSSGRLQFWGFRWSINSASVAVITRYRMLPASDSTHLSALMLAHTRAPVQPVIRGLMTRICEGELLRCLPPVIPEAEEEGSDRKSLDLNVHDRRLFISDLAEPIELAAGILRLNRSTSEHWLVANEQAPIGLIATGVGRDQQSFFTL